MRSRMEHAWLETAYLFNLDVFKTKVNNSGQSELLWSWRHPNYIDRGRLPARAFHSFAVRIKKWWTIRRLVRQGCTLATHQAMQNQKKLTVNCTGTYKARPSIYFCMAWCVQPCVLSVGISRTCRYSDRPRLVSRWLKVDGGIRPWNSFALSNMYSVLSSYTYYCPTIFF